MTYERAAEILDPEHRETYESLEIVDEACRMGREGSVPANARIAVPRTGTKAYWASRL